MGEKKNKLLIPQLLSVYNFAPKKLIAPDYSDLRFNRHFLEEKARI